MEKTNCKCHNCKHYRYSEEWDAYYCEDRNVWLESKCGGKNKEECYFECWKRLEYPDMIRYKALLAEAEKNGKEKKRKIN